MRNENKSRLEKLVEDFVDGKINDAQIDEMIEKEIRNILEGALYHE